jgi:HK97 family phage major capsid protein
VPVGFVDDVESALKFYASMINTSTIMDTATGNPLPYPTANDTTVAGERIAEGTQVSTQDVTLGNITFNAYMYSTKMVKVSRQLLQDSAFNVEAFLKDKFAERIGRIVNTDMTVGLGSGSSSPYGIVSASTSSGITAAGSSANDGTGATGATTLGSDDLIGLEHSVDVLYRPGAMYMMNDLTLKAIKLVKDKYGRPLWMPGLATKEPDSINGYGYGINNDVVAIATTVKSVLFGQLKKYMIRRVKELSVLRLEERYAEFGQVAFIGFARYDGNLLDAGTHPVKYITQA